MIKTRLPLLTYTLIGICAFVAWGTELGDNRQLVSKFLISNYYYNSVTFLPEVMAGEVWRLITPIFIHFGLLHILFNSLWLWDLGGIIERTSTSWKLGLLVFGIGLLANLAQYLFSTPAFGGMSGVVYGLLGFAWARGKFDPQPPFILNPQIMLMMLIWFVVCWTGLVGPIANVAHTAGLVLGVGWGWLEAQLKIARSRK